MGAQYSCLFLKIINLVLTYDANLDIQNNYGDTALIMTCSHYRSEMIEVILKTNANPTIQNKRKCTALHVLCERQNFDGVKIFIKQAPQYVSQLLTIENEAGETPLSILQEKQAVDLIKLLKPYENAENTIEVIELDNPNINCAGFCSIL